MGRGLLHGTWALLQDIKLQVLLLDYNHIGDEGAANLAAGYNTQHTPYDIRHTIYKHRRREPCHWSATSAFLSRVSCMVAMVIRLPPGHVAGLIVFR
jgi:hypothetical protein